MTGPAAGPAGVLHGAQPSGRPLSARPPAAVELWEGGRYVVGRADRRHRAADVERHLALPRGTRRTVPVNLIELTVHRDRVHLRPVSPLADVTVDGRLLTPDGLWLPGPDHEIVVDPAGAPQILELALNTDRVTGPSPPARPSGTTFVPVLRVSGNRLLPMAVALSWPLVPDVRPPRADGWSTSDIASRYVELYGTEPREARHTLNRLRQTLTDARTEDGRPMATLPGVAPWPWANDLADTPYSSEAAFAQVKNRTTARYFVAAGQIVPLLREALDDRADPEDPDHGHSGIDPTRDN
ncbi:hypothetical protein JS756_30900 [Streptomyces actuosus]|uniref:FHA domain-containing protein n=1 Tax=Streptomyces actuosus TaxID=1885 RepID=A0ABS2VZH7_STRAS|nr:hypothetical protein [Streptomyces actuosus]MBN0048434.1 hypothetical protein [Streptomyces actuosus]